MQDTVQLFLFWSQKPEVDVLLSVGWREGGLEKMQIEMGGGRIVRMFFSPVQTSSKVRLKLLYCSRDVEQRQLFKQWLTHRILTRNDLDHKCSALEFEV